MSAKPFEFPKRSGRVAMYDDREQSIMRDLVEHGERTGTDVRRELTVLHDLKIAFGVNIADHVDV